MKSVLDGALPLLPDYAKIDEELDSKVEREFFRVFKKLFGRWNPFSRIDENALVSTVYYFGWPSLKGEHYLSDEPRARHCEIHGQTDAKNIRHSRTE